jgi:hypothetical protein
MSRKVDVVDHTQNDRKQVAQASPQVLSQTQQDLSQKQQALSQAQKDWIRESASRLKARFAAADAPRSDPE